MAAARGPEGGPRHRRNYGVDVMLVLSSRGACLVSILLWVALVIGALFGMPSLAERVLLKKQYPMVPTSWRLLAFYAEAICNGVSVRLWPLFFLGWGAQRILGVGMRGGHAFEDACISCERCYGCRFRATSYRLVCGGRNGDARETRDAEGAA